MSQKRTLGNIYDAMLATIVFVAFFVVTIFIDGLYSDYFFGTHFFIKRASENVAVEVEPIETTETTISTIAQDGENEISIVNDDHKDSTGALSKVNSHQNIREKSFTNVKIFLGIIFGFFLFILNSIAVTIVIAACLIWLIEIHDEIAEAL